MKKFRITYSVQEIDEDGEPIEIGFGSSNDEESIDDALFNIHSTIQNEAWETPTEKPKWVYAASYGIDRDGDFLTDDVEMLRDDYCGTNFGEEVENWPEEGKATIWEFVPDEHFFKENPEDVYHKLLEDYWDWIYSLINDDGDIRYFEYRVNEISEHLKLRETLTEWVKATPLALMRPNQEVTLHWKGDDAWIAEHGEVEGG